MNLIISEKNKLENSTQYVYRVIKENILNLNLKPGETINENDVCNLLNLSRSPVRSAIAQLKSDELVNVFPQKGTFVTHFDEDIIREAWFVREVLEIKILEQAMGIITSEQIQELEKILNFQKVILEYDYSPLESFNSDNQFHSYIFEICNKKNVWRNMQAGSIHLNRLRLLDAMQGNHSANIIKEHSLLLEAIKEKKTDKMEEIVRLHLSDYERQIKEATEKYPHYFGK